MTAPFVRTFRPHPGPQPPSAPFVRTSILFITSWRRSRRLDRPIVTCPSCSTKNRLHFDGSATNTAARTARRPFQRRPRRLKSHRPRSSTRSLPPTALPVVVDYWAPWCGPCRAVAPELEKVAERNAGRFLVVKVNTDQVPELGDRYGIRSIPTMAVFAEAGRLCGRPVRARIAIERSSTTLSRLRELLIHGPHRRRCA